MDIWDWIWLTWVAIFLVLEGIALYMSRKGDTLSENVRQWFATEKGAKGKAAKIRRILLLLLLSWVAVHWLTDGFV